MYTILYLFKCMCIWFTSKVTLIIQMNEIDYVHISEIDYVSGNDRVIGPS